MSVIFQTKPPRQPFIALWLTVLFITLKMVGVLHWAWLWVCSPLWAYIAVLLFESVDYFILLCLAFSNERKRLKSGKSQFEWQKQHVVHRSKSKTPIEDLPYKSTWQQKLKELQRNKN